MKNRYILFWLVALAPLLTQAQMSADTLNIEEILIVGQKTNDNFRTPVTGENIQLLNPHDGGEIFKYTPGFSILKKGNYAMEPVLRGYKFGQLNVQFDGGVHSTNACPNRMDPAISQISMEEIEKVEVIKGPYNVRFGPVFGGIINVISKRPEKKDGKTVSGVVEGGYQSNGGNLYGSLFAQIVQNKWDVGISAGYKDYGNYKSGDGSEIVSSFKRYGYTVKLGINTAKNQRFQINWRQSFAKDIMYPGLPMDATKDNSSILSADYAIRDLTKSIFSLKTKVYYSYIDHLMTNEYRPAYKMVHAVTPVTAVNFGGRIELGMKSGSKNITYTGIDYQYIGKDGSRSRDVYINGCTNPPTHFDPPKHFTDKVWQDSHKSDLGFFIQNNFRINRKFAWKAGVRVDFTSFDIKDPENDFSELYNGDIKPGSMVSPAVNSIFTYSINDNWSVQWAAAMAQRSPDLTELFINHLSVGSDAYEYVGNPNLKAETNYQTDLIIEKSGEVFGIYADGFYSYLNNYISAVVDTTIPRKYMKCKEPKFTKRFININKAFMTGFEAGIDVRFLKSFKYNLGASYTYAQNISLDEPLPEIPPFTVNTSITYSITKLTATLNARIASEQTRVSKSFNETTTPGFTVFNLFVSYSPWKFLDINAAVTNIFNENYVEHLSRAYKSMDTKSLYYEPGRSFNIGLRFKF